MTTRPATMTTTQRTFGDGGRVRVTKGRGMAEGLLYVEAYLPFCPESFAEFRHLAEELGDVRKAAETRPDLASKALEPLDSHGEAMLAEDVLKLAHRFLIDSRKMDLMHDQRPDRGAEVVQSFVNTPEIASPHFWPGAWVTVVKLEPGSEAWEKVEAGELDAVSFQALVHKLPVVVTFDPTETS